MIRIRPIAIALQAPYLLLTARPQNSSCHDRRRKEKMRREFEWKLSAAGRSALYTRRHNMPPGENEASAAPGGGVAGNPIPFDEHEHPGTRTANSIITSDMKEFLNYVDELVACHTVAKARKDVHGTAFYDHILSYMWELMSKQIFTLGSDKAAVEELVADFADAKERAAKSEEYRMGKYESFANLLIEECKANFPLTDREGEGA